MQIKYASINYWQPKKKLLQFNAIRNRNFINENQIDLKGDRLRISKSVNFKARMGSSISDQQFTGAGSAVFFTIRHTRNMALYKFRKLKVDVGIYFTQLVAI